MANINRYFTPAQQSLEQYVPLPLKELSQIGEVIQNRYNQAEDRDIATASGLASMEALAPAYKQFRDTFTNQYKQEASGLLDKYAGRYEDPNFIKEQKRLVSKYSTDPRLQVIKQGNAMLKADQEVAEKLRQQGIKYYDPMRGFTGLSQTGELTPYQGGVRAYTFDRDLDALYDSAQQAFTMGKGFTETNEPALREIASQIISNPQYEYITRDIMRDFMSSGQSPEQAYRSASDYIMGRALSRVSNKFDSGRANYARSGEELAYRRSRDAKADALNAAQTAPRPMIYDTAPGVAEDITVDNIEKVIENRLDAGIEGQNLPRILKDINYDVTGKAVPIPGIEKVQRITSGKQFTESQFAQMTPAEREKARASQLAEIGKTYKTGQTATNTVFEKYKKDILVPELGDLAYRPNGTLKSDKELADTYNDVLKNSVKDFYYFKRPRLNSQEVTGMEKVIEGNISENTPIYKYDKDNVGKLTKFDKADLGVKPGTLKLNGFNPYSHSGLNGSAMITYQDKNGVDRTGLIELDNTLKPVTAPLLKAQKALESYERSNSQLLNDKSLRISINDGRGNKIVVAPQRGATPDGKFGLVYVDVNTGKPVASMDDIYNQTMSDISNYYLYNLTK